MSGAIATRWRPSATEPGAHRLADRRATIVEMTPDAIHPVAATGFERAAAAYERGRPGYPDIAVDRLVAALPGRRVVDLAAGTGKLTRALVARGCDVVAVEPVDAMRALIEPPARALAGTAEATGLPAASADAVTVGQAFHWFDGGRALREIHRVLRPGGVLALIWNRRRMEDEIHEAIEALLEPHRAGAPAHRSGVWRAAFEHSTLFHPLREERFEHVQLLDADGLADRVGSTSFVAALGERERARLLAAARELAAGGPVQLRHVVELQLSNRIS